ncbi:MAG: hypothetical protein ACK4SZ_15355 [Allosphingosinicella sp.]
MIRKLLGTVAASLVIVTAFGSTVTMGILHATASNQGSEAFHS